MPEVSLTNASGDPIGKITFEWDGDGAPPYYKIKDVDYSGVTDDTVRTAIIATAEENPEGLITFDGRIYPSLSWRLDGIYMALVWVRNGLGMLIDWKGPALKTGGTRIA